MEAEKLNLTLTTENVPPILRRVVNKFMNTFMGMNLGDMARQILLTKNHFVISGFTIGDKNKWIRYSRSAHLNLLVR